MIDDLCEFTDLNYTAHRESTDMDIVTAVSLAILGYELQMTASHVRVLYRFLDAVYIKLFTVPLNLHGNGIIAEG
jgi:hypothetical protein